MDGRSTRITMFKKSKSFVWRSFVRGVECELLIIASSHPFFRSLIRWSGDGESPVCAVFSNAITTKYQSLDRGITFISVHQRCQTPPLYDRVTDNVV